MATIIGQRVKLTPPRWREHFTAVTLLRHRGDRMAPPRWREQKSQSVNNKGYAETEEAQYDEPKKKIEEAYDTSHTRHRQPIYELL